ncbi:sensor histidine kinase [Streptomyces chartreusis]|uniref:sensor histidine kinase n=1 Tax=Streptomyces chartreusis TaxID=1969 RepID=UPI003437C3AD
MRTRARLSRLTIRTRLTLAYGVLFAASGAAMVGLLYLFMRFGPNYSTALTRTGASPTPGPGGGGATNASASPEPPASGAATPSLPPEPAPSGKAAAAPGLPPDAASTAIAGHSARMPTETATALSGASPTPSSVEYAKSTHGLLSIEVSSKSDFLHALLVFSAVVFLILLLISVIVGWFMAGRMLAPLQKVTATARGIVGSTLHERIALSGPQDEIRELADTFNAMLRRLEQAFEAQRRFAANASHELRTPLASMRTILQVALASPDPDDLRAAGGQLLSLNRRSTDITEALLTLARADHGAINQESVDLGAAVREHCAQVGPQAREAGVLLSGPTGGALTTGDPRLLRQLVGNLIDNAVKHNHRDGIATVAVHRSQDGRVRLTVRNSGPALTREEADRAFEPFHRLDTRTEHSNGRPAGHGLGLAIVRSIVRAHDGTLRATPLRPNGLEVSVDLPGAPEDRDRTAQRG